MNRRAILALADRYLWHRGEPPEAAAAARDHMQGLMIRFVPFLSLLMLAFTVGAWLTDRRVFGYDENILDSVGQWRIAIAFFTLLAAGGVQFIPLFRRIPFGYGIACYAAGIAFSGWIFAGHGGLDTPYFFMAYSLVFLTVLLPAPLGRRIIGVAFLRLAFLAAFFAAAPQTLAHPYLGIALVVAVTTDVGAIVFGHIVYHLVRSNFLKARKLNAQAEALREARDKSDRLLLNVLPEKIAERLKERPEAIADRFEEATVLFADICGFTPLSESMSPEALVAFLNRVFSEFDQLADRHGLEKIKTIGDAYMAAAGIPEPRADHAEAVAAMALDMRAVVRDLKSPTDLPVQMRIGIHSGPVVAGVIGRRKFIYDLWGDTVNTASRMESHGAEDVIQVSEATRSRLGDAFVLEPRGPVPIKGKGEMKTFFLVGRKDAGAETPEARIAGGA
jgi:class 3 adenylate cyclase